MKKKLLSILLCLCMVVTWLPTVALAAVSPPAGNEVSTWEELQTAMTEKSTAILIADITCENPTSDNYLSIVLGKTFTLDLNGYTIDRNLSAGDPISNGWVILNKGTFSIKDSSALKTGRITGGNNTWNGGGILCTGGLVTLESGSICGNSTQKNGGGIYCEKGEAILKGGSVCHNMAGNNGGGLATDNAGRGLSVEGASIFENTAMNDGGGAWTDRTFSMSSGQIKNNIAYGRGGGICMTVQFNTVGSKLIRLYNYNSTPNASIEISGNRAAGLGGGVYFYEKYVYGKSTCSFKIGDSIKIRNNTDLTGSRVNNLYVADYCALTLVKSDLSEGSEVHLAYAPKDFLRDSTGTTVSEKDYPKFIRDTALATPFPVVYFGHGVESGSPIQWYLLPQTNANNAANGAYFLWSANPEGKTSFKSVTNKDQAAKLDFISSVAGEMLPGFWGDILTGVIQDNNIKHNWWNSEARYWLNNDFYTTAFSAGEQAAILKTEQISNSIMQYEASHLKDKVFLLSAEELISPKYGFTDNSVTMSDDTFFPDPAKSGSDTFLMRSPYGSGPGIANATPGVVSMLGTFYYNPKETFSMAEAFSLRPGINLDKGTALFLSPAVNANRNTTDGLAPVSNSSGEFKVTMKTDSAFAVTPGAVTADSAAFTYSGATTGENWYISAMVLDKSGNAKYLGNLSQAAASGALTVDLSGLSFSDSDTLYVFNSQENGDKKTNFSSALTKLELPHQHTMEYLSASAATCTANGLSEACWRCINCGKFFSDAQGDNEISPVVAALGHSWTSTYEIKNADFDRHYLVCTSRLHGLR